MTDFIAAAPYRSGAHFEQGWSVVSDHFGIVAYGVTQEAAEWVANRLNDMAARFAGDGHGPGSRRDKDKALLQLEACFSAYPMATGYSHLTALILRDTNEGLRATAEAGGAPTPATRGDGTLGDDLANACDAISVDVATRWVPVKDGTHDAALFAFGKALDAYVAAYAKGSGAADPRSEVFRLYYEAREEIPNECDQLRAKLADLLTRTANALKGKPKPLHSHSWHDLPDLAAATVEQAERHGRLAKEWETACLAADAKLRATPTLLAPEVAFVLCNNDSVELVYDDGAVARREANARQDKANAEAHNRREVPQAFWHVHEVRRAAPTGLRPSSGGDR